MFNVQTNKKKDGSTYSLTMFYSHNTFDAQDQKRPIKTQIASIKVGRTDTYDLTLHNLELSDDIYSPLRSSEKVPYLMDLT